MLLCKLSLLLDVENYTKLLFYYCKRMEALLLVGAPPIELVPPILLSSTKILVRLLDVSNSSSSSATLSASLSCGSLSWAPSKGLCELKEWFALI